MGQSLKEKIAEILECSSVELDDTDLIRNHAYWDSLAALSLVAMLDEEYGVTLSQSEFERLETIAQIETLIRKRTGK